MRTTTRNDSRPMAPSDDELARLDQQSHEAYLHANNPRRRGTADRKEKACMVIMLVATMVALVWLFAAPRDTEHSVAAGRVRLVQQPPCGKADHAADDRCGEEG